MATTLAVVTSELQVLGLLEARAAGRVGGASTEALIAGPYRPDRKLCRLLDNHDITIGPVSRRDLPGILRRTDMIAGDVFGRHAQARLAARRLRTFTVVQDGLATIAALEQLATERPRLQRPRDPASGPASHLVATSAMRQLRRIRDSHGLTWVLNRRSAELMPSATERQRGDVWAHSFEAYRSFVASDPPEADTEGVRRLVLGTALVEDGLVHRATYERWLRSVLSVDPDRTMLWPHRREGRQSAELAVRYGARVGTHDRCVERIVPLMFDLEEIHLLPSTPAATLVDLAEPHVRIIVYPLGDHDLTSLTPPSFRKLIALVTA